MEGSSEKPDGFKIAKKTRSWDLHSTLVEKSRVSVSKSRSRRSDSLPSDESKYLKRRAISTLGGRGSFPLESRRKRSRKEICLSSFQPFIKRQRNGLNASRLRPNGLISGVGKPDSASSSINASHALSNLTVNLHALAGGSDSLPSERNDHHAQNAGKLESSNGLGDNIIIPKRPRGTLKRKKPEGLISPKDALCDPIYSDKSSANAQASKLSPDIVFPSQSLNGKQKKRSKEFRVSNSSWNIPLRPKKDESGSSVQVSSRRGQSKKAKDSVVNQTHVANEKLLLGADQKVCGDSEDNDDEENLEQNAARMLSSRFDPSCTGFSGKNSASSSKFTNESSFLQSLCGKFKDSQSETSPVDIAGRILRPRRYKGKGFVGKRRHFCEVSSRDVDPYSILKQRIRVFWPLDRSWYFGLVKDYDPATKMHYIKYDDRDEEWINLENERFKLLLFPSEVESKINSEKLGLNSEKAKYGEKSTTDLKHAGRFTESEPIIAWLARSACPVKSSITSILKKRRATDLMKSNYSTLLVEKGRATVRTSTVKSSNLSSSCIMPDWIVNQKSSDMPMLKSETGAGIKRLSFVYSRRRFHNRNKGLDKTLGRDSACGSLAGPISILPSVADGTAALAELNSTVSSMKPKKDILKLMVPLDCIQDLSSAANSFWLGRAIYFLHYGTIMHLWPMVRMEAILVDNITGLRFIAFEGCLRQAVALVCLITTVFCNNKGSKLVGQRMPSTSIGFKLSGLHDERRHLLFVLFSFVELDNSKWRYLEEKLMRHCLKIRELPVTDCTVANIKNFPSGSHFILYTSVLTAPISIKALPEKSCSDIMNRLILNESVNMNMNPAVCYFAEKFGRHPSSPFSFAAAPSFSLSLHLKLLMEKTDAFCGFQKATAVSSEACADNDKLTGDGCSSVEDSCDQVAEVTLENVGSSFSLAAVNSRWLASTHPKIENDALSVSTDGNWNRSSHNFVNSKGNLTGDNGLGDLGNNEIDERLQMIPGHAGSCRLAKKSGSPLHEDSSSPDKSEGGCNSSLNIDVQIQQFDQVKKQPFSDDMQSTDMGCEMNEHIIYSPGTAAPRGIWNGNRHSSVSPTFRPHSKLLQEDFLPNGFAFSSRKPRTQVSYSLPFECYELGSKPRSHHCKGRTYKKIRTDSTKRTSSISGNRQSYPEYLTCDANVLVTVDDRCWRECRAQIVLDSDDKKVWRLSVKISGETKYMHRAHQILQPGATNRYTHAMMWKGGKDWTLEFTDRSQWSFFKEMHEECYNRNLRAASVKNIPTPGVRLIEDADENITEVSFACSSHKYVRQIGTEVDMALDPSHVLYDMDSSDEEWISNSRHSMKNKENNVFEVTHDIFERVMDIFEKFAFAQSRDEFTIDEIEEYMADAAPLDIMKCIYGHWRKKRQRKGLPLIRQFQPALWEQYQQQLEEWELALSKMHSLSDGCQDKACFSQKPPMFAFCLRPRGLEVPNKGSKQRSHKKFMFTGHHSAFVREQNGFHASGRKLNGYSFGEEKALVVGIPNNESSDLLHSHQSSFGFSPRDAIRAGNLTVTSDNSEGSHHRVLSRSNSKKIAMFPSPKDSFMMPSLHNHKTKRNGVHSADLCEWPRRKDLQSDGLRRHQADIDDFRLHDASNAAQHASNMAKLKKERAQWLLHKADIALHKATVALMTAEAIKASEKDLIGDG